MYELAALGAATCWAVAGMISLRPSRELGAFTFNRIRSILVFLMLALPATVLGGWSTLSAGALPSLVLSGVVGMFLGDTALFAALRILGPRRMAIMYATNAPMTAILGYLVLDERLGATGVVGVALVAGGVVLAIAFKQRGRRQHHWEAVQGSLAVGVSIGLLAAFFQAAGIIIAKPVMVQGADAVAGSAIRVGAAALCLALLSLLRHPLLQPLVPIERWHLYRITASGFVGMALGMTLLLFALARGNAGVVATLSSTSPVLMLPIIWLRTGERPSFGAWAGAILVCAGTAIVLTR